MAHALGETSPPGAGGARALQLVSELSSVPAARHVVADDLRASGVPRTVLDNVLLVVTELLSNSILHAKPVPLTEVPEGVLLRWTVVGSHVLVDVTDGGGPDQPQLKHVPTVEPDGRGLAIVDALAREWQVHTDDGQVTVLAVVGPWEPAGTATSAPG